MALSTTVFRIQLLAFSLITSLLIFQYEPLMSDKGVPISLSLVIFSISQIIIMLATLFWGKAITYVQNGNRLIEISLIIRIIITSIMYFIEQNDLFILLFLLYHTVSSSIDITFEGMLGRWAYNQNRPFGKFRLFGSIGYASSGLIASFIYALTKQIDFLLLFIMVINIIILVGTILFPLNVQMKNRVKQKKEPIDKKVYLLILLGALITNLPNSFGVVLNSHYRSTFHLTVEEATFYTGLALLVGSCISEVTGFYYVDRLIQRFQAKNIILIGMMLCLIRWLIAIFADSSVMFTATYIFHGISFALIYLGCVTFVKETHGEESVNKTVINFSLMAALIGFLFTQLFSVVLTYYTTGFLLGLFIIISLFVSLLYYYYYWK
ncbi:MFS transporter [Bacillus sp. JJ722]|uniref:MFS transporter n=1 Tax=Bacillus sp. JJ722 TaxID=3122973 RepID=UPI002FFF21B6